MNCSNFRRKSDMAELITILSGLFKTDERFIMHRYYSSRFALAVGMAMIVVLFSYGLLAKDELRWDLVAIAGAMAVAKISAMAYYRYTH
jgi:hypothetical protein